MQKTLKRLYEHETLDEESAYNILSQIATGSCNDTQVASFISVFLMRRVTIDELKGFRAAMMELCIKVDLSDFDIIDIVGTGGDGKNTFNISTISAFVVAGAGIKVAKHGNYAASSVSGSSNVLEYLGYRFSADADILRRQLDEANICFLHAPLFHPAMKNVAGIRKDLGIRTFFNLLGPVINPANPDKQVLGVSHLAFARMYQYLLQGTQQQYRIVHSLDGYDEISLTSPFKVISPHEEQIIEPTDIGFDTIAPDELSVNGDVKEAANIFRQILEGTGTTAQNHVVIANSGFAIHCARPDKSLADCFAMAKESLISQRAYQVFKQLINS